MQPQSHQTQDYKALHTIFQIKDANTQFSFISYCIFIRSTLHKSCSLQFTEQHRNIIFVHHLWMFAVPRVSAYAGTPGSQSNHCSHKEPCKETFHKSFSVAGKKDSQVSQSDVKCSKYISDSRITQDTMLLDTHIHQQIHSGISVLKPVKQCFANSEKYLIYDRDRRCLQYNTNSSSSVAN